MHVYNKRHFIWGLLFLLAPVLFVLDILPAAWWQWVIALAFSAKYLYAGLSKTESARQERIAKNYRAVSRALYGRYAGIKTNLPWIITGGFFGAALLIRFAFDVVIPVWIAVCFVVILTISVFYSLGLNRAITEQIDQAPEDEGPS